MSVLHLLLMIVVTQRQAEWRVNSKIIGTVDMEKEWIKTLEEWVNSQHTVEFYRYSSVQAKVVIMPCFPERTAPKDNFSWCVKCILRSLPPVFLIDFQLVLYVGKTKEPGNIPSVCVVIVYHWNLSRMNPSRHFCLFLVVFYYVQCFILYIFSSWLYYPWTERK